MGFTFRKLYPTPYPNCCFLQGTDFRCPCPIDNCNPTTITITRCVCPAVYGTPCVLGSCSGYNCPPGTWDDNNGSYNLTLCVFEPGVACACNSFDIEWCQEWLCEVRNDFPECCPASKCVEVFYNYGLPDFPRATALLGVGGCSNVGAQPYTYMIENGRGLTDFYCKMSSTRPPLLTFNLDGYSALGDDVGIIGDSAFIPEKWRVSYDSSVEAPRFGNYCLQQFTTPSQEEGIRNRVMVIAGKNVYNYAGHFADSRLGRADPFWDNPGGSGIKQLEEHLGRSYPLADAWLRMPLWGQAAANNRGLSPENCIDPYSHCPILGWDPDITKCFGCQCLRVGPVVQNLEQPQMGGIGHYLSNDAFAVGPGSAGYTAGYFSFAAFNPDGYLDHESSPGTIVYAGGNNMLGFGNVPSVGGNVAPVSFNCDPDGTNCKGCSGATSHGYRLGIPHCSLWSLVNALYARVFYAVKNNHSMLSTSSGGAEGFTGIDEAGFRSVFSRFSTAVDNLLNSNPSDLTVGKTSVVHYHLAKVSEALVLDSSENIWTGDIFKFTFPNVFLWDRFGYENASPTKDRWKHIYTVGNANIAYDSRSISITGPYEQFRDTTAFLHEDIINQNYMSSNFSLSTFFHSPFAWAGGEEQTFTNAPLAKLVVFPGSNGPTAAFSSSVYRRNAEFSIRLYEMPLCFGVTSSDGNGGVIDLSLCSICNAMPEPVCAKDRGLPPLEQLNGTGYNTRFGTECEPVTEIDDFGVDGADMTLCRYIGGIAERNSLTASYQVR